MARLSPTTVIMLAGAITLSLSFGARSIFGIVMEPMSAEFGWPREVFSLSLAIQNLAWGVAQPFFGLIADRYGDRRALWLGFGLYLVGMALSATGTLPWMQHLGAGVFVGMGVAGTAFGLVLSVVGRSVDEKNRSRVLGTTAALGSLGQMLMPLLAGWVTANYGWQATLVVIGLLLLPMAACIPYLKAPEPTGVQPPPVATSEMLRRAFGHSSYLLLVLGFFVCGFHVAFLTAHFPAYVEDVCGSVTLGAATLSLIGFANVVGTFVFGHLGGRYRKPYLLSMIYAGRAVVITVFLLVPPTPVTVVIFSLTMGMLWLSTVPLTTALVATMFGPKHMATLYGFVFLGHQIGSFLGVWMGGRAWDLYGSYDMVWYVAIALGVMSAIVHLPVQDRAWTPKPAMA